MEIGSFVCVRPFLALEGLVMKLDEKSGEGRSDGRGNLMLRDEDVVKKIRDIASGTFIPANSLTKFDSKPLARSAQSDLAIVNNIRIATPCKMDWNKMTGDERKRYCQDCNLHVYNVSELSPKETVDLLRSNNGGRVCLQIYRRKDGTVMTRDCPVAVWKLKKAYRRAAAVAASLVAWLGIVGPSMAQSGTAASPMAPGRAELPHDSGNGTMGAMPAEPYLGEAPAVEGGKAVSMDLGGVSSVRVNNLENLERKPNLIVLGVSLVAILGTLKILLKKKSSMWIIGVTMVAMFAALGYAMVALAG